MNSAGLTSAQAQELLKKHGLNEIRGKGSLRPVRLLFNQFTDFLIILLLAAASLAFLLGDRLDGLAIIAIVVLNAGLGFLQEYKAEKAIAALKKITVTKIRTRRDGQEVLLDSRELVPGDVIFIEEGTIIPADGQITEAQQLEVNEASLTGESLPVLKKPARRLTDGNEGVISDSEGLVFSGTSVAHGRAQVQVTNTGMQTRFGKIAAQLGEIKNDETPLQKRVTVLGKQLGILGVGASFLVLLLASWAGNPLFTSFLTAVSLAVAAVPEGLPTVITITLAIGVQRMARAKTIVRKMTAVEALGSTTVIATDKTGTLTRNQMQVREIYADGRWQIPSKIRENLSQSLGLQKIVQVSALCNTASLVFKHDHKTFDVLGDTTEGALLMLIHEVGFNSETLKKGKELLEEFSFDSTKKLMSVVYRKENETEVLTKGAPEAVLNSSQFLLRHGQTTELNPEKRQKVENDFKKAAAAGYRVIAFAYKKIEKKPLIYTRAEAESQLVFLGLAAISDPPREEVKEAIRFCREAGVRAVMITGDNELTANAIATEIGLISEGEDVLTGQQLEMSSEEELKKILPKVRIFARTTPEQKYRIVKAYQDLGEVVAVTGDGVNDALALKQADVGAAMGTTGTDVAKEAADIIITDDNFATIAQAVEEGRTIFANIRGAIKYLVGCNTGEVLTVLAGVLLGWPLLLTPLQLLYVNLITDGLPALALAVTPKKEAPIKNRPNRNGGLLGLTDLPWFLETSLVTTLLTLTAFAAGLTVSATLARTLAFTTLIFVQHFVFLDVWGRDRSSFNLKFLKNAWFLTAFFGALLLQPLLIYQPLLAKIFALTPEQPLLLLFAVLLSLVTLLVSETRKIILNRR